jgi:hypothetical protein
LKEEIAFYGKKNNLGIVNIEPRGRSDREAAEVKRILSRIMGKPLFDVS